MVNSTDLVDGPNFPLGKRQQQLLRDVRFLGSATVRDVMTHGGYTLSVSTVAAILDKLYRKGFLTRKLKDRAFFYSPRKTEAEATTAEARTRLRDIVEVIGNNSLPALVDAIAEKEPALIDALAEILDQRKTSRKVLPPDDDLDD
jgi:predicted transcriptional regulator